MRSAFIMIAALPALAGAQSTALNFHARVLRADDTPHEGGLSVVFRFYKFQNPTTNEPVLHQETQTVAVRGGLFSADLGNSGFPAGLFDEPELWLGIQVADDTESVPRLRMARVPRAVKADEAAVAKALDCTGCVTSAMLHSSASPNPANFAQGSIPLNKIDAFANGTVDADTLDSHLPSTTPAAGKVPVLGAGGRLDPGMLPLAINATTVGGALSVDAATVKGMAPAATPEGGSLAVLDAQGALDAAAFKIAGQDILELFDRLTRPCPGFGTQMFTAASKTWSQCPATWNCTTQPNPAGCVESSQYPSCKAIRDDASFAGGDGTYWIDPDGSSGINPPLQVYCDMTTDSGGWTLVVKSDATIHAGLRSANATAGSGNGPLYLCNNGGDQKLADDMIKRIWTSQARMTFEEIPQKAFSTTNLKELASFSDQCGSAGPVEWVFKSATFPAFKSDPNHTYDCGWSAYILENNTNGPYIFMQHDSYKTHHTACTGSDCGCGFGWVK